MFGQTPIHIVSMADIIRVVGTSQHIAMEHPVSRQALLSTDKRPSTGSGLRYFGLRPHLHHSINLDGRIARQYGDGDGGAGMFSGIAEHGFHQI